MRRLMAKAFVTTVSLSACGKTTTPPPEVETHNPPMPTVESPPVVETAPKTRLRKRTRAAVVAHNEGPRPAVPKVLNPKDALGRSVFAGADDVCFVEVPRKSSDPPPRGVVAPDTENVDCPSEMDDPAWDHCTARLVLDEARGRCVCVTSYGNPPPPPRVAECTAGAVKQKP